MSWLKRKVYNWALKTNTEELNKTLLSLQGMDDYEVSMIVASALTLRINLRRGGQPIDEALGLGVGMSEVDRDQYLIQLIALHNRFQKEDMRASAAGVKIWIHSLRSMIYPELRILGRDMWGQLSRGFDDAVECFFIANEPKAHLHTESEVTNELTNVIPQSLEPAGVPANNY